MAEKHDGRITEGATEARQGERGPTVLGLLTISLVAAIIAMGLIWFVFFRT